MKKILSVLLCMAMLMTMLGAAAPISEQQTDGESHLCQACLDRGCTENEDVTTHSDGCPCAGEEDVCSCETCAKSAEEDAEKQEGEEDASAKSDEGSFEDPGVDGAGGTDSKPGDEELGGDQAGEEQESETSAESTSTLEANGDPMPIAGDTGNFIVSGTPESDYTYDAGSDTLTVKGTDITVSGSGKGLVIEAGASATVSGLTVKADSGPAVTNNGTLTVSGRCSFTGDPAISGKEPQFGDFVHMTYASENIDGQGAVMADWGGLSSMYLAEDFKWVDIYPMTVNSFTVTPKTVSVKQGDSSTKFKAILNVTVNGATFDMILTVPASWKVSGSSSGSTVNQGSLTVASDETSPTLTVTAEYPVSLKEYTASATVTVLFPADSVSLDKSELKLGVGESTSLKATITPKNTYDTAKWSVSPSGVISIDQKGNITALAKGTATVTVTAGSVSATCKVTVYAKNYIVTFDPNGGECKTETATTKDDGTLGTMPLATKEGLYFAGWYTEKTGGVRIYANTVINSDLTLYARWSTVPVTGDENNAVLWAALLGVSALAICAGGVYFFRKSRKGKDSKNA